MGKRGVEPKPRHHDADAVGPDDAQEMRLCPVECGLLQCLTPLTEFAKTSCNDYNCARAVLCQLADQRRDRRGRRHNDSEVWGLRQARDVRIDGQAIDHPMMRVDQHQLAGKSGAAHIAQGPTEPGRGLAPISATDRGLSNLSRLRTDIGRERLSQASRRSAVLCSIGTVVQRSESWLTLSATRSYFTCVTLKS